MLKDDDDEVTITMTRKQWHAINHGIGAAVLRDKDGAFDEVNGVHVQRTWWHLQGLIRTARTDHSRTALLDAWYRAHQRCIADESGDVDGSLEAAEKDAMIAVLATFRRGAMKY